MAADSRLVAQVQMKMGPYALAIRDNLVFATERDKVFVYDISRIQTPVQVSVLETDEYDPEFRSLLVQGDTLFAGSVPVGSKDPGVFAFDISDPTKPVLVEAWSDGETVPHGLFWHSNALFVSGSNGSRGRLVVLERSSGRLKKMGAFQSNNDKGYARLWVHNNHAYLPEASGALKVVEVSDPSRPKEVATLQVGEDGQASGKQVIVSDNRLFMANWGAGLACFDISDPARPQHLSDVRHKQIPSGASVYAVAVKDNRAYLANGWGCLTELDVSDHSKPKVIREFKFQYTYYLDVVLTQDHAICADKGGFTNKPGLDIVSLAN